MRVETKMLSRLLPWVVMVAVLVLAHPGSAQQADTASAQETPATQGITFTDTVEVNVISLYVTVVDRKGSPVMDLSAADFEVEDGGQTMEITNFSVIGSAATGIAAAEASPGGDDGAAQSRVDRVVQPSYVAVVFDNPGLEKRQRKRVLKALEDWVPTVVADGNRVMVAVLDPEPVVLTPFTADPYLILSALDEVSQRPTQGDMSKSNRRVLTRNIQAAQTIDSEFRMVGPDENPSPSGSGGGSGSSGGTRAGRSSTGMSQLVTHGEMGKQLARQYYAQIETLRRQEYSRIGASLVGIDWLIRGITGLPGRKDVLWVTEDLMMQPGVDVYETFFTKFETWAQDLSLDQPPIWGSKLELRNEFQYIAGVSQVASTVLHVVDASDRDREAASADYGASDSSSHMNVSTAGGGATGGYDLSRAWTQSEGAQYLSVATGGSFFGNSRNFGGFFDELSGLVGTYYSIGYRSPGPPDGMLHDVSVKVLRDDVRVLTHERVPNPTRDQVLSNIAISRLMINEGPNPLGLSVALGATEPADDGNNYIQEVLLRIPASNLLLEQDGPNHVGRIAVAVVASGADGNPTPPRLLELTILVPADRMTPGVIAQSRLRLMMEQGSKNLAVAVRDEGSGTESSARAASGI